MFSKFMLAIATVAVIGGQAVAQAPTDPVISYDGNAKVEFDRIEFTAIRNGEKLNASVQREACYYGYPNKYIVYGKTSAQPRRLIIANNTADLNLLKAVCLNNPAPTRVSPLRPL